ncbi:MAG: 4Fe-4S dicluster domain-containing protein [Flavobacteriales bacterium]|nr:4Fe-4S dicluster domain-containing protein [Flavobacteriales bacterium]
MTKQIAFSIFLALSLGLFTFTVFRLISFFKLTKKAFPIDRISERLGILALVAFGQSKILRRPMIGLMHALVYWGFLVITIGSAEMVIDGLAGTERVLSFMGPVYSFVTASGDLFAAFIIFACLAFLVRRHIMRVKRFSGVEMTAKSSADATLALSMIMLLMISLIGMNAGYIAVYGSEAIGYYPVSIYLVGMISPEQAHFVFETNWWTHIVTIFVFMNILPYSKHFHIFMSMPNVFLTNLKPMTQLTNMESVTREVKLMMDPNTAFAAPAEDAPPPERFGVKDIEDVNWKNYTDSLTCTECGRCTDVCPANITGKLLSPRKIMIDTRKRMSDKGPGLTKDENYSDGKSLVGDYITAEELWACTTCNACVQECPVNIDHVSLIVDMRRNLVMEESNAPSELVQMFTNIENNGSPWQFSPQDRMNWSDGITVN